MLEKFDLATNRIIQIEVLCGAGLDEEDAAALKLLLDSMQMIELDSEIAQETIKLRRKYKIKLPDALIAATAMRRKIPLWTHNAKDFKMIAGLKIYDPIQK